MNKKRPQVPAATPLQLVRRRLARYALSPREQQVALLVVRGLPNKEIASRCALSVETVKEYLKNVYAKLGIHGRTSLLAHLFGTDKL